MADETSPTDVSEESTAEDSTAEAPATSGRKPGRRKKLVGWLVVLIVLAGLAGIGYAILRMIAGPSEGTIVNSIPPPPKAATIQLEQFDGTNFSFAHPENYTLRPDKQTDPNSLETETFIASGMISKLLTITVSRLPSGKLEDDASYYMRSIHPETYKLSTQTIQGEKVMVALNSQDYQQAAFWVHKTAAGTKMLTFAISSISIDSAVTGQEYQHMLESIRWK